MRHAQGSQAASTVLPALAWLRVSYMRSEASFIVTPLRGGLMPLPGYWDKEKGKPCSLVPPRFSNSKRKRF